MVRHHFQDQSLKYNPPDDPPSDIQILDRSLPGDFRAVFLLLQSLSARQPALQSGLRRGRYTINRGVGIKARVFNKAGNVLNDLVASSLQIAVHGVC